MSQNNNHIVDVITNNLSHIGESVFTWILTIFGFHPNFTLDPGDISVDGLLRKATLILACVVSLATLYKIRKDLKKLDGKES